MNSRQTVSPQIFCFSTISFIIIDHPSSRHSGPERDQTVQINMQIPDSNPRDSKNSQNWRTNSNMTAKPNLRKKLRFLIPPNRSVGQQTLVNTRCKYLELKKQSIWLVSNKAFHSTAGRSKLIVRTDPTWACTIHQYCIRSGERARIIQPAD